MAANAIQNANCTEGFPKSCATDRRLNVLPPAASGHEVSRKRRAVSAFARIQCRQPKITRNGERETQEHVQRVRDVNE
jgi:hypothetical protein